ncbi:phosphoribosyltransferase [Streptomyces pinistramenti]|uniref:phosphoribosyltransferase n=1 Tax=Streptomyces pinistramenti TaxID=2884812 RepID=UPI001D094A74|nr:phosphoribosyltransferase family protein [Streptomyces pinistramenti]MCB5908097.1 phosphoribosyltransferase domain-containing protein [Streptomyces pinistramenti]
MTPSSARVFQGRRIWQLTRNDFLSAACLIAHNERPHTPDAVVGIARGGVELAELVAEQLHVPVVIVRARHNTSDDIRQSATGRVALDVEHNERALAGLPQRCRLLLVDDICGTGATLEALVGSLARRPQAPTVRTAVLCRNEGAAFPVDAYGWDVADWVHFPWEKDPGSPAEPLPPLARLRSARPTGLPR